MAEAEEPRPWVGQDSRARHEREHRHEHGREPEHDRAAPEGPRRRPGSDGERLLQRRLGTSERAERFYDEQVLDHLNERMREFVQRQEMFFLATADGSGECDSSFRAGPAGFLQVLGERTLAYPEYRGNGVHASLGNIQENPHLGIMLVDFTRARIGLHINGRATLVEDDEMRASYPHLPEDPVPGRRPQLWVHLEVEEAYIHCAKHIPQLQKAPRRTARDWGTDDYKRKGGDFFGTARDAREGLDPVAGSAREHARPSEPAAPAAPAVPLEHRAAETSAAASPSLFDELPGYAREEAQADPASDAGATGRVLDPAGGLPESPEVPEQRRSPETPEAPVLSEAPGPADASGVSGTSGVIGVPGQRRSRSPEPQSPDIPAPPRLSRPADAAADPQQQPAPTAMDGASGALAARGAQSAGFHMSGSDPQAWREEAERALAEAQRRAVSETSSFQGWFG